MAYHFTNAQKKQFTRVKQVMNSLAETAEAHQVTPETICDEWEQPFAINAKGYLSNFVKWLQENGHADKGKPRGKYAWIQRILGHFLFGLYDIVAKRLAIIVIKRLF